MSIEKLSNTINIHRGYCNFTSKISEEIADSLSSKAGDLVGNAIAGAAFKETGTVVGNAIAETAMKNEDAFINSSAANVPTDSLHRHINKIKEKYVEYKDKVSNFFNKN